MHSYAPPLCRQHLNSSSTIWRVIYLALCGCLALAPIATTAEAQDYGQVTISRVQSVSDGDSFTVDIDHWPGLIGRNIPVRVSDIDAPEFSSRCASERLLAKQAKTELIHLLRNAKRIQLTRIKRDKYFRINAQVWIDDVHLGQYLVKRGLAKPYNGKTKQRWCASR